MINVLLSWALNLYACLIKTKRLLIMWNVIFLPIIIPVSNLDSSSHTNLYVVFFSLSFVSYGMYPCQAYIKGTKPFAPLLFYFFCFFRKYNRNPIATRALCRNHLSYALFLPFVCCYFWFAQFSISHFNNNNNI